MKKLTISAGITEEKMSIEDKEVMITSEGMEVSIFCWNDPLYVDETARFKIID